MVYPFNGILHSNEQGMTTDKTTGLGLKGTVLSGGSQSQQVLNIQTYLEQSQGSLPGPVLLHGSVGLERLLFQHKMTADGGQHHPVPTCVPYQSPTETDREGE